MNDHEKKFEANLKSSLNRIDDWIESTPPSLQSLQFMITAEKKRSRKKLFIELLFFWMISLFIILAGIISVAYGAVVFICFQALVITCLAITFVLKRKGASITND